MIKLIKQTVKLGNSSGVLLPRKYLGQEVTIILVEKPANIKQDILKLVNPYLEKIIAISLVGSYARNEQEKGSDIDILIITNEQIKLKQIPNYHIFSIDIDTLKKSLNKNPITILPMIKEAKSILNEYLLNELKKTKLNPLNLKWHIETSKSALKICKRLLELEKDIVKSTSIIYSLILRLREAYIVDCLLKNKPYYNKELISQITKKIDKGRFAKIYKIYKAERDNKPIPKYKIKVDDIKILLKIVEDMIKEQELRCLKEKNV